MDANRVLGWGADERNFLVGAAILQIMGIKRVRLLTNNPDKLDAMAACGIEIAGREPHLFAPNGVNDEYLATKASPIRPNAGLKAPQAASSSGHAPLCRPKRLTSPQAGPSLPARVKP